jgi:hypothetical protein
LTIPPACACLPLLPHAHTRPATRLPRSAIEQASKALPHALSLSLNHSLSQSLTHSLTHSHLPTFPCYLLLLLLLQLQLLQLQLLQLQLLLLLQLSISPLSTHIPRIYTHTYTPAPCRQTDRFKGRIIIILSVAQNFSYTNRNPGLFYFFLTQPRTINPSPLLLILFLSVAFSSPHSFRYFASRITHLAHFQPSHFSPSSTSTDHCTATPRLKG